MGKIEFTFFPEENQATRRFKRPTAGSRVALDSTPRGPTVTGTNLDSTAPKGKGRHDKRMT